MVGRETIPSSEVIFHPHSFADPAGRLFRWNGQMYRAISSGRAPYLKELFQRGIVQELIRKDLLVDTEVTDYEISDYEMVVRHRIIPFPSYPNEWCAAMLKQAALTLIDLAVELAKKGFTLADGHPWNLLIDITTGKPVFVDLGSIIPATGPTWPAYFDFCRYCLYPLILMSYGKEEIARLLMWEESGVTRSEVLRLSGYRAIPLLAYPSFGAHRLRAALRDGISYELRQSISRLFGGEVFFAARTADPEKGKKNGEVDRNLHSLLGVLRRIKRQVEKINVPSGMRGAGNGTFDRQLPPSSAKIPPAGPERVREMLGRLRARSVLDISSREGEYAVPAARLGSKVVAFDTGEGRVTNLYFTAMKNRLPILPLVMDFAKPTPPRGLGDHWSIGAADRFQCEMVLALGSIHRLAHTQRLRFAQIAEGLNVFSKRWAVVEFIPRQDPEFDRRWSEQAPWYTLDNLVCELKKRFSDVDVLASGADRDGRVLLFCQK